METMRHHYIYIPVGIIITLFIAACRLCYRCRNRKRQTVLAVHSPAVVQVVPVPQPGASPAYPVAPPMQPGAPPAYPMAPPMQPGASPAYPMAPPMQPGAPPAYPMAPPMQPGAPPAYPMAPPMQPGAPPAYPEAPPAYSVTPPLQPGAPPMYSSDFAQASVQPEAPPSYAVQDGNTGNLTDAIPPKPDSGDKSLMSRLYPSRHQGQQNQFGYKPLQE